MNKMYLKQIIMDFMENSVLNEVKKEDALTPNMVGLKIFDSPVLGYATTDSEYLNTLKDIPSANIKLDPPSFWLPSGKSVVSIFFPYTDRIRKSNIDGDMPSTEWLHGRIEGQFLINSLLKHLEKVFIELGFKAVVPILDSRFSASMGEETKESDFGSNWSERHVAYAAGLGTFSLSKGLITEKGVAGRFGSLITDVEFESTMPKSTNQLNHSELYKNCIMCGACERRCPQNAISIEDGKLHKPCSDYLDKILSDNPPYYGCGKCQVGVPCEYQIP